MTATVQSQMVTRARPGTLAAAVALTVFNALAPFPLLPTMSGVNGFVVTVAVVFAVVSLLGAWGLWRGWKWAAILLFVISLLNALLSFGGIFTAPDGSPDTWDRTLNSIGVIISLGICALITVRTTRRALH
ncbi:MAG: hypothetical protein R3B97_11610 [Dehalococcoidia bacterium]|nr:hypothetical protein [Dehalococcoidia bacterium]MCB9484595.1 hypothetical protein [Thermoflexaceae bacterium]